jgi:hypothetical protein
VNQTALLSTYYVEDQAIIWQIVPAIFPIFADSKVRGRSHDHDPSFKPFAPLTLGLYYSTVDNKHDRKPATEVCINEFPVSAHFQSILKWPRKGLLGSAHTVHMNETIIVLSTIISLIILGRV